MNGALRLSGDGYDTEAEAALAGTSFAFRGRLKSAWDMPNLDGRVTVKSRNAAPLLQVTSLALPDVNSSVPLDLAATLRLEDGRLALSTVTGQAAGSPVRGDVEWAFNALDDAPRLTGQLALERLSLSALSSIVLGAPQPAKTGAYWSDLSFAPAFADPPSTALQLNVAQFDIADGWVGQEAALRVTAAPNHIGLEDMRFSLNGGKVNAHFGLRRDKGVVSLSGDMDMDHVRVDRPAFSGALSGLLEFSSTGKSLNELAGGLAGVGRLGFDDLNVPRTDPQAPARVIANLDPAGYGENDLRNALARELDKAPFVAQYQEFTLSMAAGQLRLTGTGATTTSVLFDLRAMEMDARVPIVALAVPKDWSDAPPQITAVWHGTLSAPQRLIELGPFVTAVTNLALAREAVRIEAQDADIRERAAFVRRLRGLEFMHKREQEVADFQTHQRRIADEQKRKAAEAAKLERDRKTDDARKRLDETAGQASPSSATRSLLPF